MTMDLDDDLRRVLGRAVEVAPQAPSGFPAEVAVRSRRRRTRTQAVAAAIAVVIVAGGVGVTVRSVGGGGSPQPAVRPVQTTKLPDPVEKVWPDAVWKMPQKLPNGRQLRPLIFIDDRTVLAETWESHEKANAVYAYDLGTRRTRKIADIRTPKGVFAGNYAVGGGRIVWQTIDEGRTRFWWVPASGGEPAEIRTDSPVKGRADELTVVGDRVAFSLMEGGVFTFPVEGGRVIPVEGAERHHILHWPWVGTPGSYTPDNEPSFEELLDAETGQTSKAVVRPGEKYVKCGVTTCVGTRPDRTNFYRLRDGSQERDLPQPTLGLAYDRFMTVRLPRAEGGLSMEGQALLDLATGKQGDLGLRPNAKGGMVSVEPGIVRGSLVSYPLGGKNVIIDLARIR